MSQINPIDRNVDSKSEFMEFLESALAKLTDIWDTIGITGNALVARRQVVMLHLTNLVEEMVREEEAMKATIMDNVEKYGKEVHWLCKELGSPLYEPEAGLTVLQLEKDLRLQAESLRKEKTVRLERSKHLSGIDQHLCDVLCTTPYYIPTGMVPSHEQLSELEKHIQKLETEKDRRQELFKNTKQNIITLLDHLEMTPNTSFERDIIFEEEDSFLLSSENMKSLKQYHDQLENRQKENCSKADILREQLQTLWDQLNILAEERSSFLSKHSGFKPKTILSLQEEVNRLKLLKIQNVRMVIGETRRQLEYWWDKCYISTEKRRSFLPFYSDDLTEELLEKHELEIRKLKSYYEQNKEVFEKVNQREILWNQFLEFERKASDPNRLFNKDYNLLKEEKARNKLMKELPKIEQDVEAEIEQWERKTGNAFLISGMKYSNYIHTNWEKYKIQKEKEKAERQHMKARQIEEEMLFGSKPAVTPSKKRVATNSATPLKSASKVRKINDFVGTPGNVKNNKLASNPTSTLTSACMPPRAPAQLKTVPMGERNVHPDGEKVPGDELKNKCENNTGESLLSHTMVSSSEIHRVDPDKTLAPVGQYTDFALMLNENIRSNSRSSIVPKPIYH